LASPLTLPMGLDTDIRIYSIGSLVWALTKGPSDRESAFDLGQVS